MKLTGLNIIDFTDVPFDITKPSIKYIVSCNTNNPNSTISYHSYTSFSEYLDTLLNNNFIILDIKILFHFNNCDRLNNINILVDWYKKHNKTILLTITSFYIQHLAILLPLSRKITYKMFHITPRVLDIDAMDLLNPKYDTLELINMFDDTKTIIQINSINRLTEINKIFN